MFPEYPYSDTHQLNLDWVVTNVTELKAALEAGRLTGPQGDSAFIDSIIMRYAFVPYNTTPLPTHWYNTVGLAEAAYGRDIAGAILCTQIRVNCHTGDTYYSYVVHSRTYQGKDGVPSATDIQNAVDEYLTTHPTVTGTFTNAAKNALLTLLEKVAYIDEHGQDYLDTLERELFAVEVASISAVYTQSGTVYETDSLDSLRDDLVVTAIYSDSTSETVTTYTLSGTLTEGTSTITVSYEGKTTTFTVNVTALSLDDIAYGTLTYRDLFITNNEVIIGDFETTLNLSSTEVNIGNGRSYKINAGTPVQTTEAYDSPTHSLKCYGSTSTQILYKNASKSFAAQKYLVCASVNVTRYSAGFAGGQFNWPATTPTVQKVDIDFSATTDGFAHAVAFITLSSAQTGCRFYIGSYTSANLDCYVDDIVVTPVPSDMTENDALSLYETYLYIVKRDAT